jgi:hypothetical protein
MLDPELPYRHITSGEPGAIRERRQVLLAVAEAIDGARDSVGDAAGIPVWTGDGATAFLTRTTAVLQAAVGGRLLLIQTATALGHVAGVYAETCSSADESIAFWRNRPPGIPPILENLLAAIVSAQLTGIGTAYDAQLAAVTAVLTGDAGDIDLDALDDDTRTWVERGLDKTEDWLDDYGSTAGPLIPNTQAAGDDRGLTPQGLGYDPATGMLLQTYYKDGEPSVLSVIDPRTGKEVNEVVLTAGVGEDGPLGHAGGVTVDGDNVYVSSGGSVYTYSMEAISGASSGAEVDPSSSQGLGEPGDDVNASYTAFRDGKLYVGDFEGNTLRVYEKGPGGSWVAGSPPSYTTPPQAQGVVVRDDGFIYSTSEGRTNSSTMVVQHGHGDYDEGSADSYEFPNMAEGVVEVDGQLVATYESGSSDYQHATSSNWLDGLLGGNDDDELWASPFMTTTPLSALGLAAEGSAGALEAEPQSLTKAAAALGDPAASLKKQAGILEGVTLPSYLLGDVPSAGGFSAAIAARVDPVGESARTSATGIELLADALEAASHHYTATDQHVSGGFARLSGRLG